MGAGTRSIQIGIEGQDYMRSGHLVDDPAVSWKNVETQYSDIKFYSTINEV